MSTVKIVIRQKPNSDGTLPLCLRVTKDRKSTFVHLGYAVNETDWDAAAQRVKKTHPNSARLNNLLIKKLADYTDKTLELEATKQDVTVRAIRQKIKPTTAATFFPQAQAYLDALQKSGKYNEYTANKPRIGHFKEFLKNQDISFTDITVGCLDNFVVYLRSRTTKGKKGKVKKLGERTIMNHLSAIRSVFAYAKRQEAIDGKHTPFGKGKIAIRFPDSKKEGLNAEEVEALETVDLADPRHHHARNLWLFSFYFAGMRASDVFRLRWSDFSDGRLYYAMNKNDKGDSLKVPAKAHAILEQYRQFKENEGDLVFPELRDVDLTDDFKTERTIAFKTSAIDKILRLYVAPAVGITKKLTMHIARHTFGKLAGNKIQIKTLQKLYRHTHLSTTAMYQQNFDHDEADNALDAVINKPKVTARIPAAAILLVTMLSSIAA